MSERIAPSVEEIFLAALDCAPEKRAALVVERSGGDARLCEEVLSLLSHHADSDDFLSTPLLASSARDETARRPERPNTIGAYEILGVLGEGGMGVVYLARQKSPRRCVALKVVRSDATTPRLLRRFEHEGEVLGRLRHPGIAQIHEAGTADTGYGPQPYFALEWVRGPTLTAYANAHALSVRERLSLLAEVCDAVEYAHSNGVIHRDLKPSNILVDDSSDRPQVKVLDFGVARAAVDDVRESSLRTKTGQIVGTLAYMSPEQAAGDPDTVDTRADVYALGAIAYELMAGRVPLELAETPLHQAVEAVCEREPVRLGSLSPALRGDVETIVSKALEKDRSRRYASAADLARDIRHHLADRPIEARPPSRVYVVSRFARRHKELVLGLLGIFLVLVLGIAGTTTQAVRAAAERDRAEDERTRALASLREAESARAREAEQRTQAMHETERARGVANYFRALLSHAMPEEQGPRVLLVDVVDRAAGELPGDLARAPAIEADVRHTLGMTYRALGEFPKAAHELAASIALRRSALGADAHDTLIALRDLGSVMLEMDRIDEAATLLDEALAGLTAELGPDSPDVLEVQDVRARLRQRLGRLDEADQLMRRTLALRRDTEDPAARDSGTMSNLGSVSMDRGHLDEAEELSRRALEAGIARDGEKHPSTLMKLNNLAGVLHVRGRREEAEALYRRAFEIGLEIQGERHPDSLTRMNNLASELHSSGQTAEAESLYRRVLELLPESLGADHFHTVLATGNLALVLSDEGRYAEAERLSRNVLETLAETFGEDDMRTIGARYNLASVLHDAGSVADAYAVLDEVVQAAERVLPADHWQLALFRARRGACLLLMKRYAEAEPDLVMGWEGLSATLGDAHQRTTNAARHLVELFGAIGEEGCSERWRGSLATAKK